MKIIRYNITMESIKVESWSAYIEKHPNFTGCLMNEENNIYWFQNGEYHREDGPACEYSNGNKVWCKHGKYHREDGPAIEWADGSKGWYLNGVPYHSEQDYRIALRKIKLEKVLKKIEG